MGMYYDRNGDPMEMMDWARTMSDMDYKVVIQTEVAEATVSTVWLGLDHSLGLGPPAIFETMIFGGDHDQWQDRYSTEAAAKAGHDQVVAALRAGGDLP